MLIAEQKVFSGGCRITLENAILKTLKFFGKLHLSVSTSPSVQMSSLDLESGLREQKSILNHNVGKAR